MRDGVKTLEEGTVDHPNGVVSPTDHDKALTRAVVLAAATVSVRVLDHLIVSAHESFSFWKAGLL